jgi:hypothetical protein
MKGNQQNFICLAIIIAVVVIVGCLGRTSPNEPTGLLSLNENAQVQSKPYSVDDVKVYQTLPVGGKVLGEVTVELAIDTKEGEQQQVEQLLTYAKTKVGAAGANGIVVDMVAQRGTVWYFAGKVVNT